MKKSRLEYDMERTRTYLPQLRQCAGLTAEGLAEKLDMTKQGIRYIETHPEAKFGRVQYIGIRLAIEDEIRKNPQNFNLIDCYDMVYSEPNFFEENKQRVEYVIHQAVEDTKLQKKNTKKMMSTLGGALIASGSGIMAGATAPTIAIGGVAAVTFPIFGPLMIAAMGVVGATTAMKLSDIKEGKNKEEKGRQKENRASSYIFSPDYNPWLKEALNQPSNI